MKSGPIIIIEDDADDKQIFEKVLQELDMSNRIAWFRTGKEAYQYLSTTSEQPFIIFCDINLPGQKGTDFKKQLDDNPELRKKSIPFLFYSTSADQATVNEAYLQLTVQGYFEKQPDYKEIVKQIKIILDYWMCCKHPNTK